MWRVCVVTRGVVVGMVEACGVVLVVLGVQIDIVCVFCGDVVCGGCCKRV